MVWPTFPRTGGLITAELCSWDCDKAMEVLGRETLEQDLGRILLEAIRGAKDATSRFVVPVGSEEVHVEMSLKPLNPQIGPDDPLVLNLVEQLPCAAEQHGQRIPMDGSRE